MILVLTHSRLFLTIRKVVYCVVEVISLEGLDARVGDMFDRVDRFDFLGPCRIGTIG